MLSSFPALVTVLALLLYIGVFVTAGRARGRYGIQAPAVTGAPEFERALRVQHLGDLIEAASAYAIRPLLIFLNLLKGDTEEFAQFLLAHADQQPAHPHAIADMAVNIIGIAFRRSHSDRLPPA